MLNPLLMLVFATVNEPLVPMMGGTEDLCYQYDWQYAKWGPGKLDSDYWNQAGSLGCKIAAKRPIPPVPTKAKYTILVERKIPEPTTRRNAPLRLSSKRKPVLTTPTPGDPNPPKATERDVQDQPVEVVKANVFDCPAPAIGWLGVTDNRADEPSYRQVDFDGGSPEARNGSSKTVPQLNEIIRFSADRPASIFDSRVPCFLRDGVCAMKSVSGTFQVVGRLSASAGPQGQTRWQLCLVAVEGSI